MKQSQTLTPLREAIACLRWLSANTSNEYEAFLCRCAERELVTGQPVSTTDLIFAAIGLGYQSEREIADLTRLPSEVVAQLLASLQQAGQLAVTDELRDDDELSYWLAIPCLEKEGNSQTAISASGSDTTLVQ